MAVMHLPSQPLAFIFELCNVTNGWNPSQCIPGLNEGSAGLQAHSLHTE